MQNLWGAMLRRWLDPGGLDPGGLDPGRDLRLDRLDDHLLRDAGMAEERATPTASSCHPIPEPFGLSDFFGLETVTVNGDTGSAGLPASFNLRRATMKLVVPTTWKRRTGDSQMRAIPRHSYRPTAPEPLAEREFRISRGCYECLSGLLRP